VNYLRAGLDPLAWATIRSLVFRDTSWVCFLLDFVGSAIGVVPEELGVVGCNCRVSLPIGAVDR
jgi:hypothetical protein